MNDNLSKTDVKIALFFTIGLLAFFFCLGTVRYEVNDDMAITALIKGLFGLAPSGEGIFISPFLGGLLFSFYKLSPAVSWFSLFLYLGLTQALFLASLTILTTIRSVGGRIAGLLGVACFICLAAFQVNFAAVSLLFWVTGCAFLQQAVRHNLPANLCFWLASSQLAAAYLLRPSLLPLLILFAIPLFLTLLLEGKRAVVWRAFTPLVVALLLSLLSGMVIRKGDTYPEYLEFNKIRSEFNDTSRALPSAQTPQALFAAKWSNEDYLVSLNWWLHDSTFFNTEQIKTFLERNAQKSSLFSVDVVKQNFSEYATYLKVIVFWMLVLLLSSKLGETRTIKSSDLLTYLFLVAVVLLLMGIRFPPRVAYPCFLMLFLNSLLIFDDRDKNNSAFFLQIAPSLLFVVFLIYIFIPVVTQKMAEVEQITENKKYIDRSLLSILQTNGSDSIIVDVNPHILPTNYLPFQENDTILKNRVMPGGWLVGSSAYLDFLQREGLGDRSTVVAAMIDNRRIVLRFWDSRRLPFETYVKNVFLRHLRQRYNPPGSERQIGLKIVNDFRQGSNGLLYFQLVTIPREPVAALLQNN